MRISNKPLISLHGLWSLLMIVFIVVIALSSSGCRSSGHVVETSEAVYTAETVRNEMHGQEYVTSQLQLESTMRQVTCQSPTWTVVTLAMADSVWDQMPAESAMLASDSVRSVQLRLGKDKNGKIAAEAAVIKVEGNLVQDIGLVLAQTAEKTEDQSYGQDTITEKIHHTATNESPAKNRGNPTGWKWCLAIALLAFALFFLRWKIERH